MSEIIRTIVVDDEPLARRGLLVRLAQFEHIEVIAECANGRDALDVIVAQKPDLVFLDIQMPGLNGFDVLRKVSQSVEQMPVVVFVTAYDQYAIRAFEVRALDYLLKPVDEDRLAQALERISQALTEQRDKQQQSKLVDLVAEMTGEDCEDILKRLAEGQSLTSDHYPEHIAIKESGEITRVAISAIEWVDAAGDYMCIHAGNETHILRRTMKELEKELNPKNFQRIHRSAIVNINQVEKLCSRQNGEYHLILQNGAELKVSRSYKDKIKQLILGR
ncbi:LytR/AlgR family response regulator transcription factor [Aliidiomarina maris]|uniref:DNA-binding response regulator n=1 Tax=Aliidiomarina maris TaxID=531312 RepID=A0A327X195_9GAMM|nr:LytTR family DNA-binding domain-containing protein [Aliidiomarina maris]MBA3987572.1 DNA-binding response regulator [Idiomarina sp.]RAJ98958.1 LytTR family two component transcriptional regulator [Aliidiomarina maris]RUO25099.1 DNA-binding response regulator [Aliidiomarina maris]